jgi:hypothetical protein
MAFVEGGFVASDWILKAQTTLGLEATKSFCELIAGSQPSWLSRGESIAHIYEPVESVRVVR